MIAVEYHGSPYVPSCGLWLDPRGRKDFAFVSHAHADHIGAHGRVLCTPETAKLMANRLKVRGTVMEVPCREPVELGNGWRVMLLPAGHVLGSAMLHLTAPDGSSLLHTGDFKLRASRTCDRCELREADVLIMETTFGLPRYVFPPSDDVARDLVAFCRATLDEGGTPVVSAYSLGKAQEVAAILLEAGLALMGHPAVVKIARLCRELRREGVVPAVYAKSRRPGHVLLAPPSSLDTAMLRDIPDRRIAAVTGWALHPGALFRFSADAVFPLSDHAGYDDLLEAVRIVQPKRIFTIHGYAREFAGDLRRLGYDARALGWHEQLDLNLAC